MTLSDYDVRKTMAKVRTRREWVFYLVGILSGILILGGMALLILALAGVV